MFLNYHVYRNLTSPHFNIIWCVIIISQLLSFNLTDLTKTILWCVRISTANHPNLAYRQILLEPAINKGLYLCLQSLKLCQKLGVIDIKVAFPVIQNIILLLPHSLNYGLVAHRNDLNPFDPDVTDCRVRLHGGDHVSNLLQTFAESVKLPKDVVLTIKW